MRNTLNYEFIGAYPISISSMQVSYESSSLLKCTVSMSYLRYVITELISPDPTPFIPPQATKSDKNNTQELPVAQANESKVVIQNTGPQGEGLYDSATGEFIASTAQQQSS
jgi:hypothetical protein